MSHIDELRAGFLKFRDVADPKERESFKELVDQGQQPRTLFVACCDSRVDPALITRSQPGELFVVRNIANLVPAYDGSEQLDEMAAALEFSVEHLHVENVVVMGHSRCAGVKALLNAVKSDSWSEGPLHNWLRIAESAARETVSSDSHLPEAEQLKACGKRALTLSMERLASYPSVQRQLKAQKIALHAWFFSMGRMQLEAYDPWSKAFRDIT
jgi:carbonic anhydrase